MFLGTFHNNLDAKNRLTIPSKILCQLQGKKNLVVSKGLDGCLELRLVENFEFYTQKLLSLSQNKSNTRVMLRQLLANASEVEIDSANRILIPANLLSEAKLTKETVIIGLGDKCEIWDREKYENFKTNTDKFLEELVESVDYE